MTFSTNADDTPLRVLVARRAAALSQYARWEREHPRDCPPTQALEGIGTLYEWLPPESRIRPLQTGGIARLHRLLRILG